MLPTPNDSRNSHFPLSTYQLTMTLQAFRYTILFSELGLTSEHIEKNLGYQQGAAPDHVYQLIENLLKESEARCNLEGGYLLYGKLELSPEGKQLWLGGRKFEVGKIIGAQMEKASGAAVFLCTAGRRNNPVSYPRNPQKYEEK